MHTDQKEELFFRGHIGTESSNEGVSIRIVRYPRSSEFIRGSKLNYGHSNWTKTIANISGTVGIAFRLSPAD